MRIIFLLGFIILYGFCSSSPSAIENLASEHKQVNIIHDKQYEMMLDKKDLLVEILLDRKELIYEFYRFNKLLYNYVLIKTENVENFKEKELKK